MWNPFRKKIRKDAGTLTLADLDSAPLWEFCLDEEGVDGQDECTVRPVRPHQAIDPTQTSGVVVADFTAPTGRKLTGKLEVQEFRGPWPAQPTLFLPKPVGAIVDHPLLHKYNKVMKHDSPRIDLALPWPAHESAGNVRTLMDLAYRALGMSATELFPLVCRPRVAISGWPQTITINGFLRPVDRGGEDFETTV